MKAFRERFKQHPLQTSLSDLWTTIEKVHLPKYSDGEAAEDVETLRTRRDAFARFLRVSFFISRTIDHADGTIWTPSAMGAAQTVVNQLKTGLDQFVATMGQLQNEPNDDVENTLATKELRRREDQVMDLLKAIVAAVKR